MKLRRSAEAAPVASTAAPWRVLVVDDEPDIHELTELSLRGFTYGGRGLEILRALSGAEARDIMTRKGDIAVALVDVVMETDDAGLRLVDFIRKELGDRFVRLVIRTGQPGAAPEREVIERYDIDDYKDKTELTAQKLFTVMRTALRAWALQEDLLEANRQALYMLAVASEHKDEDTGAHIQRLSEGTRRLALHLGIEAGEAARYAEASVLHDIGKLGVPDAILQKPGSLTPDEFATIKRHAAIGEGILSHSDWFELARACAATHHERWDGSGYPHGLKGEAIPFIGRIVAVMDVFDALTHARPYKQAWPIEQAVAEIERGSGTQFDPRVVESFLALHRQGQLADLL